DEGLSSVLKVGREGGRLKKAWASSGPGGRFDAVVKERLRHRPIVTLSNEVAGIRNTFTIALHFTPSWGDRKRGEQRGFFSPNKVGFDCAAPDRRRARIDIGGQTGMSGLRGFRLEELK